MKMIATHQSVEPIRAQIRNAFISFSQMTVSVVAVVSDVIHNGKPVAGYGSTPMDDMPKAAFCAKA